MKLHTIIGITIIILIVFITGYQLGVIENKITESNEIPVIDKYIIEYITVPEIEQKQFTNIEDLKEYLNPLKTDQDFRTQYFGYPDYDKLDYAKWMVKKGRSDGYDFDIQYESDDTLKIIDIYCTYTFTDSNMIVYFNPVTLNIEKKKHYLSMIKF